MDLKRKFEPTDMTKLILMALGKCSHVAYNFQWSDRKKFKDLCDKIQKEKLDVRLVARED